MRVDYQVGFNDSKSEWICPEHSGYAREKFIKWWRERAAVGVPIPASAREAALLGNPNIPPLQQTLAELEQEFQRGTMLKALGENGAIIGSVRFRRDDNTVYIGKLMVSPDQQGKGLGTSLLTQVEALSPGARLELFTSSRSVRNIALYERCGFKKYKETVTPGGLTLVYLEKNG